MALGACTKGRVEAEAAGLEFGNVETAVRACHGGGKDLFFSIGETDENQTIGELEGLGNGGFKALFHRGFTGCGQRLLRSLPGLRSETGGTHIRGYVRT